MLSTPNMRPAPTPGPAGSPVVAEAVARQQALARQLATELNHQQTIAHNMLPKDPKMALSILQQERQKVETAGLDPPMRDALLRSVDHSLAETQKYIEQNRPRIELAEKNNRTRQEVEREKQAKYDRQEKVAVMVNDFNRLMDEERFPEAEVVAKRAAELDPKNPVVEQLNLRARSPVHVPRQHDNQERRRRGTASP